MANIDELNFEVILNDDAFNQKAKADIALAKELNVQLSTLLNIKKQVGNFSQADVTNNRKAQQILVDNARAQERITREKVKTEGVQKRINAQIEKATRGYQSQSRILNELKGVALGYLSVQGAGQLLSSLVRVTGEFELQKTTLAAMLGDLNKAEQVITKIQGLAVESPFQFKELTTYAKQLSAFSVPAEELYDTTKMLADISAGLGVGMDRIVLAYGQVRSAAFLRGQEVRQFTEAGIPILNELAKQFSELEGRAVSTTEVFDKISKRLVPFEMVAKVFKDMTSEGGKFYNMQEVQAETLRGKISNLKDAYEVMLNEIGTAHQDKLKGAIDTVRRMIANYEEVGRQMLSCVAIFGITRTALELLGVSMGKLNFKSVGIVHTFRNLAAFALKNPYVLLAAGITAVGAAMYKANDYARAYLRVQKSVTENQEKFNRSLATETSKLDSLYAKLKFAKEGTEEYNEAKKQIYTQYAGYISELKNEGVEVGNLAILYNELKNKITEATRAKYRSTAKQDLEQKYTEGIDDAYSKFENAVKRFERRRDALFSEEEKEGLWQYLLGDENILKENPVLHGVMNLIDEEIKSGDRRIEWLKTSLRKIITEYEEGGKRINALLGEGEEGDSDYNPFDYNIPEGEGKGKSPAQKAIEEQIKSVQKLQDAYETLMPYLNEVQMKSTLKTLFPNIEAGVIDSLNFDAELERLADKLEEFDEEAAQRLRDTISKDVAGTIADSFKAIEQYKKMLDSWLGEDFDLSGEGVSFDISKIISNLNREYSKIDQKRKNALDLLNKAQMGDEVALAKVREVYGEEFWQKYLVMGQKVIDDLAQKERQAARKTADEKIRDLSSKDLKERMERANINLTDFDDKTLAQINEALNRLYAMRNQIANEIADIEQGGITEDESANIERLKAMLEQLQIIIEDTGEEYDKKLNDNIKSSLSAISSLGDSISGLSEAMGRSGIAEFGKNLSTTANMASQMIEALESDDTIAIIANMASVVISKITDIITAAYEEQDRLTEATLKYRDALLEIRRASYSGIFGTDEMGLAAENAKILKEAQEDYENAMNAFLNDKERWRIQKYFGGEMQWGKMSVADVVDRIANSQGWDLYRENGEVNLEALISYYDAYSEHLTREQKAMVDSLIEGYNAQDEAAAQSAEYLTSLFSGVADSIAESMIDAFLESGDAAIDMGNIISDVSRQMVADLIKSIYLMPILNDYKDEIAKVDANTALSPTEATEQKLNLLESALREISDQSGAITETIERFKDYFGGGEEGTTDLGEGIKGITEDQANLLASYLNAIRADVSYSKTLWVRMDANLQRIADMFTSSPTLMEYQAQIASNTYNTSIATQEILAELRSVVTTDSGDASIRVYS